MEYMQYGEDFDRFGRNHLETDVDPRILDGIAGSCKIDKDSGNLIGISIGGGAPFCPSLYIVQIFENTPASRNGALQPGDEIIAINGQNVRGQTKTDVAKKIQSIKGTLIINYIKLKINLKDNMSLDIFTKKLKHKFIENLSQETADNLGLSRAVLCNDILIGKLNELKETSQMFSEFRGLIDKLRFAWENLSEDQHEIGRIFSVIGVKDYNKNAFEVFSSISQQFLKYNDKTKNFVNLLMPLVFNLDTFIKKAVSDTMVTVKKYLNAKFIYLSYCLKVKEMDDEEGAFNSINEPLWRVESGNYDYRAALKCRQLSRGMFTALRNDVMEKLELLDQKHVQDIYSHLQNFARIHFDFHDQCTKDFFDLNKLEKVEPQLPEYIKID